MGGQVAPLSCSSCVVGEHKNPGASSPRRMRKPDASPRNAGSLTRDPSPKYGFSTHFFMLSYCGRGAVSTSTNWPPNIAPYAPASFAYGPKRVSPMNLIWRMSSASMRQSTKRSPESIGFFSEQVDQAPNLLLGMLVVTVPANPLNTIQMEQPGIWRR